ncbi:hypothetical protein PIB30_070157 [Stylosanthes scabra]|uniref:Replication factor A C-terminal domain-containing protein n=1 Tax=Stylosanthes scabra TaxID=79078 RepID=A0ABU6QNH5_9FABA|nr:hypothetical protein [Stylosanthes scabra]
MFRNNILDTMHGESQQSSMRISHIGKQNYRSAIDDMWGGLCNVKSIEDVLNAEEHDWCFISRHDRHKKCKNLDDDFYCDNCNKAPEKVELRYKLFAYVSDHFRSMCVVLWDTESTQIVGLNAEKVRNLNKEVTKHRTNSKRIGLRVEDAEYVIFG